MLMVAEKVKHTPYFLPFSQILLDVIALVGKIGAKQTLISLHERTCRPCVSSALQSVGECLVLF